MNPAVFREYDIRGNAERDFSGEFVVNLGRALGTLIRRVSDTASPTMAVGRDCRVTSPALHANLVEGITSCGVNIVDIGVVPTPVLYFAAHHTRADGAVIVTGSHNPPQDNGFKMLRKTASVFGDEIRSLRSMIEAQDFATSATQGSLRELDITDEYLAHALGQLQLGPRRCNIVVDAGNGAAGPIGSALYKAMNFPMTALYCEMDGRFPNHHPDPTVEENLIDLRTEVAKQKAEIGIAFDGDGDRVGVIDGQGRVLWGDQLMILFGREILKTIPGATFIGEVKCSQALFDELARAGGNPIMWKVGHSLIKTKMKQVNAALGGEMSGHIFFENRYLGFDDGIYSGARLLEILSNTDTSLAEMYDTLPVMVNTPEIRVPCDDDKKFEVVARVTKQLRGHAEVRDVVDVDGVRANFGDGWGLVRASNTQPALVVRCEAKTKDRLAHIQSQLETEIANARNG